MNEDDLYCLNILTDLFPNDEVRFSFTPGEPIKFLIKSFRKIPEEKLREAEESIDIEYNFEIGAIYEPRVS